MVFKIGFSSSYVNFSDSEIQRRASEIMLAALPKPTSADKFLIKRIVNQGFKTAGTAECYKPVYTQYLKSLKLFV